MSGLLSPDTGYFRLFSLFSFWRASARLHLKKKKLLENFSVAGACSFHGADFCHNDKEAAVNTRRIYKAFAKVRAKIRPSKPMRVRSFSAQFLYPSQKQKQPSFEDCFFSSIFPVLSCYNFMQCKGVRCVSQNFDRWCGARSFLLTRDFTVDFCFAKIAAATNLVSLRETGSSIPLPTPKAKTALFRGLFFFVNFPFFAWL